MILPCANCLSVATMRTPVPRLSPVGDSVCCDVSPPDLHEVLVEQVLEDRTRALVARRVHVREVLRDDRHARLLRFETGLRYPQRFHAALLIRDGRACGARAAVSSSARSLRRAPRCRRPRSSSLPRRRTRARSGSCRRASPAILTLLDSMKPDTKRTFSSASTSPPPITRTSPSGRFSSCCGSGFTSLIRPTWASVSGPCPCGSDRDRAVAADGDLRVRRDRRPGRCRRARARRAASRAARAR